jgi:hypothetical protein
MILRFLLYGLISYLLFKLVFNFIIPLFKTTKQIRQQFKDVQSRMQEQMNAQHTQQAPFQEGPRPQKVDKEDYLEFEEIKEK